jgi:P-type Cu+ transporter
MKGSLKQLTVDVKGMHCASCSSRIEKVVGDMEGVSEISVNLAAETMKLVYDAEQLEYDAIAARVKELGFELGGLDAEGQGELHLNIGGMHCASCSARIEKVVGQMEGVAEVSVNLADETGRFIYDKEISSPRKIKEAIISLGFTPSGKAEDQLDHDRKEQEKKAELGRMKRRLILECVLVIPLLILSMGEMMGLTLPESIAPHSAPLRFSLLQLVLTVPIMWLGRSFYVIGIPALLRKSPNMDSLIAIGTGAAFIYSLWNVVEISLGIDPTARAMDLYFETVGVLITLVSLGKYMENRSKYRTSDAIRQMMDLAPKWAILLDGDEQKKIPAAEIEVDDILLIKPGASIPTDGRITQGETSIDESLMTGESMPVFKKKGDKVYGGTVNTDNTVRMAAEQTGENTMLSHIIRMVREAQGSKAPIARIADKVSYYFVPIVIGIAITTGLAWFYVGDVGFPQSLRFFIAVLVISCPCAMGLATPISIMVGTGRAAQLGILVKNGETLEKLEKVDTIIFDKTGTITSGKPEVVDFINISDYSETEILQYAASAEQSSEHPLAEAIVAFARKKEVALLQHQEFTPYPGKGISADFDGVTVQIGNRDFMEKNSISVDSVADKVDGFADDGKTVLFVSIDKRCSGIFAVADTLKPEAVAVVSALQKRGREVVMLTGDNRKTAEAIARQAGIRKVYAEVMPDEKASIAEQYQKEGRCVAMVGDGINDAPALAQADVGIAMGTGIDIAIESGDVVLMKGNLDGVNRAIELSREVMKNIRQNLFWAFGYNVLGIPIAAGLLYMFGGPALNPMFAGAAMALSSVSVVTNALRLRLFSA